MISRVYHAKFGLRQENGAHWKITIRAAHPLMLVNGDFKKTIWDMFPQSERQTAKFLFQVTGRFILFRFSALKWYIKCQGYCLIWGPKPIISFRNSFVFYWLLTCLVSHIPFSYQFVRTGLILLKPNFSVPLLDNRFSNCWLLVVCKCHVCTRVTFFY